MASGNAPPCRAASVKISEPQSVCRKLSWLQPRHRAAPLDDQIDRLRGQRSLLDRLPAIDGAEDGTLLMSARSSPQRLDGRPDEKHPPRLVRNTGLGPAELDRHAQQGRRLRILGIERHGTAGSSLTCSTRSLATSLRGLPPEAKARSRIARSRLSTRRSGPTGRKQPVEHVAGDGPLALTLPRPREDWARGTVPPALPSGAAYPSSPTGV